MTIYNSDGNIKTFYKFDLKDNIENNDNVKVNDTDISNNSIEYKYVKFNIPSIYINNEKDFKSNIHDIITNFYIGIYLTSNALHIATEKGNFYTIYLSKLNLESIKSLFNYSKPKIVCFNLDNFIDFIDYNTSDILDLQVAFKVILRRHFNSERDMFDYFNVKGIKDICDICFNFIELAKKINIYIEKKKLNSYLYLELHIKKLLTLCTKNGFPIDVSKYDKFMTMLKVSYDNIDKEKIDYNDKDSVLNYLIDKGKFSSLNYFILKNQDKEIYKNLLTFHSYNDHNNSKRLDDKIYISYDTFNVDTLSIKENFTPNSYYFIHNNDVIIEGNYKNLYYRILAELTRDKTLIEKASEDKLLEYILEKLGIARSKEKKFFTILVGMFIEAYANGCYDDNSISSYFYKNFNTIISNKDIKNINDKFNENMRELVDFFKNFDGNSDMYLRFSTKIFHPYTNSHLYIRQIENLIYKTMINYVNNAIIDFNNRYNNTSISIVGFINKKLLLLANSKYIDIAIDILNRYMVYSYKRYIKNTKYYNITVVTKDKSNHE